MDLTSAFQGQSELLLQIILTHSVPRQMDPIFQRGNCFIIIHFMFENRIKPGMQFSEEHLANACLTRKSAKMVKTGSMMIQLLKSFTGLKNWRPQIIENGILLFRFESLYQTTSSTFERKIVWGHNSWRKMKRNGYLTTLIILHGFKQLTYLHFGAWFHPGKCDSENLH